MEKQPHVVEYMLSRSAVTELVKQVRIATRKKHAVQKAKKKTEKNGAQQAGQEADPQVVDQDINLNLKKQQRKKHCNTNYSIYA